ncbi:MAG: ADP-ribosylglycohydrolase family protein [Clostridia bacterium]|nr:ADP-ribosylglycohydrolase family protein [Clostridia bacterium]
MMTLAQTITKLRTDAGLTEQKFAEKLYVTRQIVQRWEKGTAQPELATLIRMAKMFGLTLDELVLSVDPKEQSVLRQDKEIKPDPKAGQWWEVYADEMRTEYRQSMEEGLDIERYAGLFEEVAKMESCSVKDALADALYQLIRTAPIRADYTYDEPSDLPAIKALRKPHPVEGTVPTGKALENKIAGAWYGRIAGCLLGKPVECIRTTDLHPLLKASGNYPMHRYIRSTDITEEIAANSKFWLKGRCYADTVTCMPWDDDTNYTVLGQILIERCGRDFIPQDVANIWLNLQPKDAYCTAERVAFCNFIRGFAPPASAVYKNPYREWIGAQIRGDYFGYVNPGDPETAADMAWRDAAISHVKNGIYGEMFISAMIACAAKTDSIEDIILGGLGEIPATSRLYESILQVVEDYRGGVSQEEAFAKIHEKWDETNSHDWCHTISNAMIVAAALLYGKGEFGPSICMAVQACFDTDCNGATVGSILGMRGGIDSIGEEWIAPICDTLETPIFGVGKAKISTLVEKTLKHIPQN